MGPMERADVYDRLIAEFALRVQRATSADQPPLADGSGQRPVDPRWGQPPASPSTH